MDLVAGAKERKTEKWARVDDYGDDDYLKRAELSAVSNKEKKRGLDNFWKGTEGEEKKAWLGEPSTDAFG
jgi:hypothetical protein